MLVELATEGNSQVSCRSAGDGIGGVERFVAVVGAAALADLHVLEARLHAGESQHFIFFEEAVKKQSPRAKRMSTGRCQG